MYITYIKKVYNFEYFNIWKIEKWILQYVKFLLYTYRKLRNRKILIKEGSLDHYLMSINISCFWLIF